MFFVELGLRRIIILRFAGGVGVDAVERGMLMIDFLLICTSVAVTRPDCTHDPSRFSVKLLSLMSLWGVESKVIVLSAGGGSLTLALALGGFITLGLVLIFKWFPSDTARVCNIFELDRASSPYDVISRVSYWLGE